MPITKAQDSNRRTILGIVALTFSLLLVPGCDQLNPYKIGERSVKKHLTSLLGPAKNYNVNIQRSGSNIRRGYISHLKLNANELQTKSGFQIRYLEADLYGVRFNSKSRTVQSVERSNFTAYVTEPSANAYLAGHDRGIPGLKVEFEPETIVVHAAPQVLGVTFPVVLRGKGSAHQGNLIHFNPDALAISRLNIPAAAVRLVEQRINPVFDLDDLKLPANLSSVESAQDEILLRGEVKFP